MKNMFSLILFCLSMVFSLAQSREFIDVQALHFELKSKNDTIDFIVLDTSLNVRKPVFLFCQGSMPVPLFTEFDGKTYPICGGAPNFDLGKIREKYHLVVISMPKTPVAADFRHLNESYCYVPDTLTKQVSMDFLKADYLQNYVDRGLTVLKFLRKQSWVNNSDLIVAGHSQGTKVACKIACADKHVKKLGLFSPNPFGRIDEFLRRARLDAQKGKISWEEADRIMEEQYAFYKTAFDPGSIAKDPGLLAWQTFSEPFIDDWLQLKIPVFIAYGSEDRCSDLCDLVPLFFIREGKNNLTMKRYLHVEHNFFPVESDGKVDYDNGKWKEIMNTFLLWTETESKL
ncbi:MAG: hypothetical protein ACO1O6_08475 [Bacteroidota bacterium]